MSELSESQIVSKLDHALRVANLNDAAKKHGGALLFRLTSPIRVAILGPIGSGKTQLLNMLAGQTVVSGTIPAPTIELTYGPRPRCFILDEHERELGQSEWPTPNLELLSECAFVKVEYPLEVLKSICILETASDGTPEDMVEALHWSAQRSDIAIWCTQEFSKAEQDVWSVAPDQLKDHSFLALTKADELSAAATLAPTIERLQDVVSEEFLGLYPVATLQYLAASGAPSGAQASMRRASGGGILIDAVLSHAKRGRQADLDAAALFLARYESEIAEVLGDDQPVDFPPREEPAPSQEDAGSTSQPAAEQPADDESLGSPDAFSAALARIDSCTASLKEIDLEGDESAREILALCSSTTEDVSRIIHSGSSVAPALCDEVDAASETTLLLELEKNEDAAADAITLLLQLSREIHAAEAA